MFNFFLNLALCVYSGSWLATPNQYAISRFIEYMKVSPIFNMFNNSTENFYNTTTPISASANVVVPDLAYTIAVILSTICCISVFFIIVKALKKLFTCFIDF